MFLDSLNAALLVLVWWFGFVWALDALIMERYHVTLWSIPSELFTEQTAHMALYWGLIGSTFSGLFGLAGWLTDWICKSSTPVKV